MSRKVFHKDDRITAVEGVDHMLGKFLQLFDKEMESETPEGEGLVFDWSEGFGVVVNFTGCPNEFPPRKIIEEYIKFVEPVDDDIISISNDEINDIINNGVDYEGF